MIWQTTRYRVDLTIPRVMGIVNVTPDSFSDGGRFVVAGNAIAHAEKLLRDGADILDIGGESSRPGARPVSFEEESARVWPVVKAALSLGCPVSLDTTKPTLMQRALDEGVDIINDINALRADGASELVIKHPNCGICLMHMKGDPASMQSSPDYVDVVSEVGDFLAGRAALLEKSGVDAERIVLDPGIGFGKTPADNLALLAGQTDLIRLGYPLLVGWSRKSTLGAVTGRPSDQRLAASLAAALASVHRGARVVRVHDVAETVDALKVWRAARLP
jgi:dihydropteroate synthase